MNCFIKKIFSDVNDEFVHLQFQKFSRGTFKDRALIKAKKSAKGVSFSTTSEYANELVRSTAETLEGKTQVKGVIVTTSNLDSLLTYSSKKQFMGIKQYVIDAEMSGQDIMSLCDKFPDAFFALSFVTPTVQLKIKPKAPKSAKPSTSEKGPNPDFCSVKTEDEEFVKQFIFDVDSFKDLLVTHTYVIKDIVIPQSYSSPEEMRKNAVRKGTLIRELVVDGVSSKKEAEFSA